MKITKQLCLTLCMVFLLLTLSPSAQAARIGSVAGQYYTTDIVAKVNGSAIDSICIDGRTLICADQLIYHGFNVTWNAETRTLQISYSDTQPVSAHDLKDKDYSIGEVAGSYYYTDIVTTLDGVQIASYNLGDRTYIVAEDMRQYGYYVFWDATARALVISSHAVENLSSQSAEWAKAYQWANAYAQQARRLVAEYGNKIRFDLIFFDGDNIPELVVSEPGYWVSMYTYHNGRLYCPMETWPYGAMGNYGYSYLPGANSMLNIDLDSAGAEIWYTFMHTNNQYDEIEPYLSILYTQLKNPSLGWEGGILDYGVPYINGIQISQQEFDSYFDREYIYMEGRFTLEGFLNLFEGPNG